MLTFLKDNFNKLSDKQLLLLWLVFCFVALTYKLGEVPPYHTDENYYVESTRNMVESGDYLTPIHYDKKRFAKPILYYWLMSVSYKIFGVSLVSARLTSAFFGSLTIGLLYLVSSRLFEGRIALYSVLILPATFMHFQISRWATTDIVLSFFVLLALYFFVRLYQNEFKEKMDAYLFYLAMGLGFMTKGPPAVIIPVMVAAIFLLATRRREILSKMCIGQGLMILVLVISPWFVTMFLLHGDEFKNHIVGAEIKNRLVHDTPFSLYYFGVLFRYYLPWVIFFVAAVFHQVGIYNYSPISGSSEYFNWKNIRIHFKLLFTRENEPALFCYIWILVCLVLFTLVRIEHSRYMLPASSAIVILIAKFFSDIEKEGLDWPSYKVSMILTSIVFFLIAIVSGVMLYSFDLIYNIPFHFFFLSAVFLAAGFGVLRFYKKRQLGKQVFIISFSLVLVFSFLSGEVLPHINRYPMKLFSEKILSEKIPGPIGVYQLGNQRVRLGVLTGQKTLGLYQPAQIKRFLNTGEHVLIIMREKDYREKFFDLPLKIVAEDIVWSREHLDGAKLKKLLEKTKLMEASGLTEKIYLLSKNNNLFDDR